MKSLFTLLLCIAALFSCGKPECHNSNPVFESNTPASPVYKKELARMLNSSEPGEVRYFVKGYIDTQGIDYLLLDVIADDFCASATVALIQKDDTIAQLAANKAEGYHGAEISGLVTESDTEGNLSYKSCDKIID